MFHTCYLIYTSQQTWELGTLIHPILQMWKLRHWMITLPKIIQLLRQTWYLNQAAKVARHLLLISMSEWVKSLSRVRLFATPWTVAHQVPPSMGISRQEYWSGLPFPSPGDLRNPGIEPRSPVLQADALTSEPPEKPVNKYRYTSTGMATNKHFFPLFFSSFLKTFPASAKSESN